MKIAIDIVQNIVLPKLEKDPNFSEEKVDAAFWEKFATDLLHFEEDAKPLYAIIYSLELGNPEKIIDKLPNIYSQFLKELAESYVLNQTSDAIDYLLKTNNKAFFKDVRFLQTMQQAIKSVERKRIKADLSKSYERLTFELSDADLANATKKKGREDLKEKMKVWDRELEEQESVPVIPMVTSGEETKRAVASKAISLSWIKYAAAACITITAGALFFKYSQTDANRFSQPTENTVVTTDDKKETTKPQNKAIVLAAIETVSEKTTVLELESIGFSGAKKQQITINYKDASKRIASLEKFIDTSKTIDSKILSQYKAELASLKTQKDKYVFDGKELTLFMKNDKSGYSVLLTEDQIYFLKKGSVFYHLKISKVILPLEKVSDATTIETLEKISFENE
ncbi:hypothetical protein [Flavobacterium sp. GSP6]|uniref:hypothetical protein n=1 Tax=Flavobacterium sp. GSP6 TaxID=2497488 RepID=UPI000F896C83|nr:hypothetical protein [Flavobacterium sp. GSP6]RTZ05704.1 hypothetical protein EKM03_07760 [Flavobacterium sp. GSP6]